MRQTVTLMTALKMSKGFYVLKASISSSTEHCLLYVYNKLYSNTVYTYNNLLP